MNAAKYSMNIHKINKVQDPRYFAKTNMSNRKLIDSHNNFMEFDIMIKIKSGLIIHSVLLRVHFADFQCKQQIRHDLYIDEGYRYIL